MDGGIQCTLSEFDGSTKLWGGAGTLEGRDGLQKDMGRPQRWEVSPNLMKYSKAKGKVLLMGEGNPKHKYRLGRVWES